MFRIWYARTVRDLILLLAFGLVKYRKIQMSQLGNTLKARKI